MTAAMQNINAILTQVRMAERDTLGVTSRSNCVYRLLTVFQCLLLFPCFGIRNAWRNQEDGTLASLIKARKDVFYRFMENPAVDWRKALWHISVQLWNRIHMRSDHKAGDVCLILDDTDHEKTGRTIERIGRVHSHLAHKAVPGFKCLFREISKEAVQLSVAQQIWGLLQELVSAIARVFGLLDEEIHEAVINHSDEMAHIAKFYNLKSAS